MSKAARIRELYAQGFSVREIADKVGCSPEYVRIAARQRAGGSHSEGDKRWRAANPGKMAARVRERLATDPEYRQRRNEYKDRWLRSRLQNDPEYRERHLAYRRKWQQEYRKRLAEQQEGQS
jgi:uncharacterized protein YjcR